jgi:hypothetical protein
MNYDVVIPATSRHKNVIEFSLPYVKKYLNPKKIVIISKTDLVINSDVEYIQIDEDKLCEGLTFDGIKELIAKRDKFATKRTGWHYQQLLKLGYAYVCNDEYYLIWDSDTIPLRPINMFENNAPIFDVREGLPLCYYTTMNKLFKKPVIKKNDYIYISEHMIYKKKYVEEMFDEINSNANLLGKNVFEKIINAINVIDLLDGGFSEYETYGCYVSNRYVGEYKDRRLRMLRNANAVYGDVPTDEILREAAQKYDTVSFENWHVMNKDGNR